MIPAILSCIFVIYLYRTLNEKAVPEASESSGPTLRSLNAKVDALQTRLSHLVETNRSKGR